MKTSLLVYVSILIASILVVRESQGKTYAYLVGTDGQVMKIDTDTDTILGNLGLEKSSSAQERDTSVVADKVNNNLFVVTGRFAPSVYVYDLKTLAFKKDLGIKSGNRDVGLLISPNGKQLYVRWFDSKEEGWFFDLYDAQKLTEIRNLGDFSWEPMTTFSSDGSKIYVYEKANKKIKGYETTNFTLITTIDLDLIWKTTGYRSGIEDLQNQKIVIRETKKVGQGNPPEISYFAYDLKNQVSSGLIITGVAGDTKLSPDGTKLFISDEDAVWSEDRTYVMYQKSTGKLHVYDVATAKEIGVVPFRVDRESQIIGIHPTGGKVYIIGNIQGSRSLIVMDVVNFKASKTLNISKNVLFMIFYEE